MTNNAQEAANRLAIAVTSARLSGQPVDHLAVARYAVDVLGDLPESPPPPNDSLTAQLTWATAELTKVMTWIDGMPESLARICTACADISVGALRELAELKASTAQAELTSVATRFRADR
jgi:hypothetical protein